MASIKEMNCMSISKLRAGLLLLFGLPLALAACIQVAAPTQAPTPPVIIITQVVTEVIPPTPLPATPTRAPTNTPFVPTPTPTYDPYKAPIYYPLDNCVASRLHIGDLAMVSLNGQASAIRYGTDLHNDTILTYAQPGAILEIVDGPYCNSGWLVWYVRTADGTTGYTPEGNGNEYWLFPTK
jgi:hypothetical protein